MFATRFIKYILLGKNYTWEKQSNEEISEERRIISDATLLLL